MIEMVMVVIVVIVMVMVTEMKMVMAIPMLMDMVFVVAIDWRGWWQCSYISAYSAVVLFILISLQSKILWRDTLNRGWLDRTDYTWNLMHRPTVGLIR